MAGLIICDPPIHRVLRIHDETIDNNTKTWPYASGYIDFMPLVEQMKVRKGPPRSSLMDDLVFYLHNYSTAPGKTIPRFPRIFVEKIIASHMVKTADVLQKNIDDLQWYLSRKEDIRSFAVDEAVTLWSDMQAWQRRVAEYQDDIEGLLLQLEGGTASLSNMERKSMDKPQAGPTDFQHLRSRYSDIGQRTNALADAITALSSLAGNRASLQISDRALQESERAGAEARSVKYLTIMGTIFLPLSLAASILSLNDSYLPGTPLFWIYFSISIPLLVLVLLVYIVMNIGYQNGRHEWSFSTAKRTGRKILSL